MLYIKFGIVLCLFWLLLSGHTGLLLLSLGLGSVVLVLWLIRRMDRSDQATAKMIFSIGFLRYLTWLIGQVLLSNIDVARRVWDPKMPINPASGRIDVSLKTPLLKVIYANSITLTPGTVTMEVGDDYFVIHALNAVDIEALKAGEMEGRLKRLESQP
ncbi:MAG: Na+/H+ antiporter subunit E [Candidatus Thiodiazotropha sp.]